MTDSRFTEVLLQCGLGLRLQPITYSVDTFNVAGGSTSNPKLVRAQRGLSNVVAEQVIGFRVGACLWNGLTTDTTNPKYNYSASTFGGPATISP